MTKSAEPRPVRPVPASRPALSSMETYYFRVLCHWYRFKRAAPSLGDLTDLCRRSGRPPDAGWDGITTDDWPSKNALRRGLLALECKGYAKRNTEGKFEVIR
ncbi:MAG TPA: hypothetical protein VFZ21_26035 [Gemmatimonadaceae bacterium]|nr:hypothetical protein [Gemmatimonadaceae bacterium]